MPAQILFKLQMDRKQKLLIGTIFTIGSGSVLVPTSLPSQTHGTLSVIIISIVRIIYVYKYVGELDVTYYQAAAALFSTAELNVGVICTSMIGLNPLVDACRASINRCCAAIKAFRNSKNPLLTDDKAVGLEAPHVPSHDQKKSGQGVKQEGLVIFYEESVESKYLRT